MTCSAAPDKQCSFYAGYCFRCWRPMKAPGVKDCGTPDGESRVCESGLVASTEARPMLGRKGVGEGVEAAPTKPKPKVTFDRFRGAPKPKRELPTLADGSPDWYRRQSSMRPAGHGCQLDGACLRDKDHEGDCKLYFDPEERDYPEDDFYP